MQEFLKIFYEVDAGVFVVVSIAVAAVTSVWLARMRFKKSRIQHYFLTREDESEMNRCGIEVSGSLEDRLHAAEARSASNDE